MAMASYSPGLVPDLIPPDCADTTRANVVVAPSVREFARQITEGEENAAS